MDSLLRLASGSTIEDFARDVYIKSNLTTLIDKTIKSLQNTYSVNDKTLMIETQSVTNLCNIFEAILLHGLKVKLTSRVSSVFSTYKLSNHKSYQLEFWSVVLILCHNELSNSLQKLTNISTDIGRCRAWIRQILNEGLITSYLEALTSDVSLLHGFYRSSAYIRDREHTDLLQSLLKGIDCYVFQLNIDDSSLNCWSYETLKLIGVCYVEDEPSPVITAVDAMQLISSEFNENDSPNPQPIDLETPQSDNGNIATEISDDVEIESKSINSTDKDDRLDVVDELSEKNSDIETGNNINRKSGWSTSSISSKTDDEFIEESYDTILQNYSIQAVLSSTPDIRDFTNAIDFDNTKSRPSLLTKAVSAVTKRISPSESVSSDLDFEIIPKSVVLNNSEPDTQKFLIQLTKLANECGLDQQEYKCNSCARPIGMIYGKSRMCQFDGYQYCIECHNNDEEFIPARILYNWDFTKYPVAKRNKHLLYSTESEPLFDIKIISPLLYSIIPDLKQILELRTQLFFLHAYLFTCQEKIAMDMRKLVWPREHLFEHIHLYSLNDLTQVPNNMMIQTLRKVITFAKKHVLSCPLCTLKGYYCEICKSAQILYPFDTESTKRCEKCKTVFHLKCFEERYDKNSCPKCLRIEKREVKTTD